MLIANRRQMQDVDKKLLESYSIVELVDKASDVLLEYMHSYSCVHIICGGGNNGADGLSLALKCHQLEKKVVVCCLANHHSEANEYYLRQCEQAGLLVNVDEFFETLSSCDVVVDGLFGFGCCRNPEGVYGDVIGRLNRCGVFILSIDVPSGLDCDSGYAYENCVQANMTVTFFAMKRGFLNPSSKDYTGKVVVGCLDVDMDGLCFCESYELVSLPKRRYDGYKNVYGKAFLICGSDHYRGAALLSSKACVYTGCGITYLHSCESVLGNVNLFVSECVLEKDLSMCEKAQAILIGCGVEEGEEKLVHVLKNTQASLVIDASSLRDLVNHLDLLNQERDIILTPHLGEFKALVGDVDDVTAAAIDFARKYHVIVVLKGPHTLVSDGYKSYHCMSGSPAMACGGSGDVLAGMIVSLLAQGMKGMDAACAGVYLHGKVGERLAKDDYTAIPSRMIELIPSIMKEYEE